jgi:Golgi nucleoside diphosphatase
MRYLIGGYVDEELLKKWKILKGQRTTSLYLRMLINKEFEDVVSRNDKLGK